MKFALHERGARCNLYEALAYPLGSDNGAVLVMRAAEPIPEEEFDMLSDAAFPDWEHVAGTAGSPFEHDKAENWGRLEGRLVAIDYSAASELYD
jgi:hypothetical protein